MEGKNFLLLEDADSSKKILRDQIAEVGNCYCRYLKDFYEFLIFHSDCCSIFF